MYNNITSQPRHAGIPLHSGTAPTPSRIHHYLWRWKIGAALLTLQILYVCALHIEQPGGVKAQQNRLQQAVHKGLSCVNFPSEWL